MASSYVLSLFFYFSFTLLSLFSYSLLLLFPYSLVLLIIFPSPTLKKLSTLPKLITASHLLVVDNTKPSQT